MITVGKGKTQRGKSFSELLSQNANKCSKNAVNIIVHAIIIAILLAIEVLSVILIVYVEKNQLISFVYFTVIIAVSKHLGKFVKTVFGEIAKWITQIVKNPKIVPVFPKMAIRSVILGIVSALVLLTAVAGEACWGFYAISDAITFVEEHTEPPEEVILYDFSTVTDSKCWSSIYFEEETDANMLVDKLQKSIHSIAYIPPTSEDELKITENYGTIVNDALAHEKFLHDIYEEGNSYIINGPLPNECYKKMVDVRLTMENTKITPENRNQLRNYFMWGGKYNLGDSSKQEYEKAVRFAWGTIYISVAWGQYKDAYMTYLIDAYEHLKSVNQDKSDQLDGIINALKRLDIRFKENPPKLILEEQLIIEGD